MCGIVATLGEKQAAPFLLQGLQTLEYRGYDSAGLAVWATRVWNILRQSVMSLI